MLTSSAELSLLIIFSVILQFWFLFSISVRILCGALKSRFQKKKKIEEVTNKKVSSKNSIWCHCASACRQSEPIVELSAFHLYIGSCSSRTAKEREKEKDQVLMNIINVKSNKLFLLVSVFFGSRCRFCYLNMKL